MRLEKIHFHEIVFLMASLSLLGCSQGSESSSATFDSEADCYAPRRTLNESERQAYIKKISTYAQEAEMNYGVPAAAITAMAAVEGGYGQTKTAINANNLFGYKYLNASMSGGRSYYTLTCQPTWDENNKYIVFSSDKDAVSYVAQRLANSARYKPTTDAYVQARNRSSAVDQAVNTWVAGISDAGYNYNPAKYKESIRKMNNNYVRPSWERHANYNTYKFSVAVHPFVEGKTDILEASLDPEVNVTTLTLDAPKSGITVSGNVEISVRAPDGVTGMKFFSKPAGTQQSPYEIKTVTSAPFNITWATKSWVKNGNYDLEVLAYEGGQVTGRAVVTVTVRN